MIDRAEVARLLQSIREHVEIAENIVRDDSKPDRDVELEVMSRMNNASAREAQLRAALVERESGRRDNLHIIGGFGPEVPAA